VLLSSAAVPASQPARARAAVPWALEEGLVADVEDLHFALASQPHAGRWSVAVVSRADMDAWLARCREAGLQPHALRPAPLALPAPPDDGWVALEEPGQISVRTGEETGFACEPDMLALLAESLAAPTRIRRLGAGDVAWPEALEPRLEAPEALPSPMAAWPCDGAGIDLLQGPYSRRERAGRQLRRWRTPAILAAALALIAGGEAAVHYLALGQRQSELNARLEAIYSETFPDAQKVSDPRAQMAARVQALEEGGGEASLVAMLAEVGAVLADHDNVRLRTLTWRGGTLEVDLTASELQVLDQVQSGLGAADLASELQGAQQRDGRVHASMVIKEASA
jgi:general secretion pathway protein L